MTNVVACIDGSPLSAAVSDCAAWASQRLQAPLTLLHVLDAGQYPVTGDLSGSIGLGSREQLLEELARLDEQRGKLALEQGRLMLEEAKARAMADGVSQPLLRQRHGDLLESLEEIEDTIRLLVMGLQGTSGGRRQQIGSHVESVLRTLQRPILIVPDEFHAPTRAMLAFDGGATTRRSVQLLAASPLLRGLPVHVVMVGEDGEQTRLQLDWAMQTLEQASFETHTALLGGDVEPALHAYQAEHGLDLLIMGAYGHSRIREFLVGSTTTAMLRTTRTPLLVLR